MGTCEGTLDWGVLDEKRNHRNTNIERSKWDFGSSSVILCHNCVGAVAYVETKCVLKVKLLSVPRGPVQDNSNRLNVSLLTYTLSPSVSAP
jgi:hypothetical protein